MRAFAGTLASCLGRAWVLVVFWQSCFSKTRKNSRVQFKPGACGLCLLFAREAFALVATWAVVPALLSCSNSFKLVSGAQQSSCRGNAHCWVPASSYPLPTNVSLGVLCFFFSGRS